MIAPNPKKTMSNLQRNGQASLENFSQDGVIQIRLRDEAQLFKSFDPSPFLEKDLDKEAEDYIVSWAREEPRHLPLTILVHMPKKEIPRAEADDLGQALNNFFSYRADMTERELKELFRYGRAALSIGVPVLFVCLFASQLVPLWFGPGPLSKLISESFLILGWVANWEPLEVSLYDWWPIVRRRNLYRRLADAEVRLIEY
jgi:hypothetical protein